MPTPLTVRVLATCLGLAAVSGLGLGVALAVRPVAAPTAAPATSTSSTGPGRTTGTTGPDRTTGSTPPPPTTTSSQPAAGGTTGAPTGSPTWSSPATSSPAGVTLSARRGLLAPDQVPLPEVVMGRSGTGRAAAANFELLDKSGHCWSLHEQVTHLPPPQLAVADYFNNDHMPTRRALLTVAIWDTPRQAGRVAQYLDRVCYGRSGITPRKPGEDLVVVMERVHGPGWSGFVVSEHYYQNNNDRFRTAVIWAGRGLVVLDLSTFDSPTRLSTQAVTQAALASLRQAGAL